MRGAPTPERMRPPGAAAGRAPLRSKYLKAHSSSSLTALRGFVASAAPSTPLPAGAASLATSVEAAGAASLAASAGAAARGAGSAAFGAGSAGAGGAAAGAAGACQPQQSSCARL